MSHPDTWHRGPDGLDEPWATIGRHRKETATMYDAIPATEARAREEDYHVTEAVRQARQASPFGNDFPEHAPHRLTVRHEDRGPSAGEDRNANAILDALGYTADRLAKIEHQLGDLNGVLMRLGHNLAPVMTDGRYIEPPGLGSIDEETTANVDRRSTIARNITGLGHHADKLGNIVGWLRDSVAAMDEALELKGVDA